MTAQEWSEARYEFDQLEFGTAVRGSRRQRKAFENPIAMPRLIIAGDLELFWPLLVIGERCHVGRGAVAGHGRYRLLAGHSHRRDVFPASDPATRAFISAGSSKAKTNSEHPVWIPAWILVARAAPVSSLFPFPNNFRERPLPRKPAFYRASSGSERSAAR